MIEIYLRQKNNILPGIILEIETYCHRFEIHHVINMYFTIWKLCILQNTKDLGKGSTKGTTFKGVPPGIFDEFYLDQIGQSSRDLKGCFSIFRIYKDSQFNNTKIKILKYKYKTRLRP